MNPFTGELVGTMILIVLGCGVNAGVSLNGSFSKNSGWIVIALGWGLAVAMAIYAVGSVSGAHINPAVTVALAVNGSFPWENVPTYILGQLLGAVLGGFIVYFQYLPHWRATAEQDVKLGVFATSPAIPQLVANLSSEIIGTFFLILGLLTIGANEFTEGLNPLIVGFLIVAIGLSLGGTTGYAINPARDLGPRLAHFLLPIKGKGHSNWRYAPIPIVGPLIGGSYGGLFYSAVFKGETGVAFWVHSAIILAILLLAGYQESKKGGTQMKGEG